MVTINVMKNSCTSLTVPDKKNSKKTHKNNTRNKGSNIPLASIQKIPAKNPGQDQPSFTASGFFECLVYISNVFNALVVVSPY